MLFEIKLLKLLSYFIFWGGFCNLIITKHFCMIHLCSKYIYQLPTLQKIHCKNEVKIYFVRNSVNISY